MTNGFIILRHVNNKDTDMYWKLCYKSIRKYYLENYIMIIDDNSNYDILDTVYEKTLYNTKIIKSEYPGRGELLPYYYYLHNKLFDTAVIIHDSVFINSKLDMSVNKYKLLWEFEHNWDQPIDEIQMIKLLNNSKELLDFHFNRALWKGCFGGMSIITHDYLTEINNNYDLSKLLPYVKTRYNRMSFERVIACILQKNSKKECLLGNIQEYCKHVTNITRIKDKEYNNLPIIKVWTGR